MHQGRPTDETKNEKAENHAWINMAVTSGKGQQEATATTLSCIGIIVATSQ